MQLLLASGAAMLACGSPAQPAASAPIAIAAPAPPKPLPGSTEKLTQPPSLLAVLRIADLQRSLGVVARWQGVPTLEAKRILVEASDLKLAESAIDLSRPLVLALYQDGERANDVSLIGLTSKTEVLANYPHPTEVAAGVLEVQSRNAENDDEPPVSGKPKPNSAARADAATNPEAHVCWLGTLPSGDAMVCGRRASVSAVYSYFMQVVAVHAAASDAHLEVFAKPLLAAEGMILIEAVHRGKEDTDRAPHGNLRVKLLEEALRFAEDAQGVSADIQLSASSGELEATFAFAGRASWLSRLLLASAPEAASAPPAALTKLPNDISEVLYRPAGSAPAWAPAIAFAKEGLLALREGKWKPGDAALLESIGKRFELAAESSSVFASGFDLAEMRRYSKSLPPNADDLAESEKLLHAQYSVHYTDMRFADFSAMTEDFAKLMAAHATEKPAIDPLELLLLALASEQPSYDSHARQFGKKRMNLTGLPAGAFACELSTFGFISAPNKSPAMHTVRDVYIAFPLDGGTAVVRSASESLALARARSWSRGEGSLSASALGAALQAAVGRANAATTLMVTPRTLISRFVGEEVPHKQTAKTEALLRAFAAPPAFTPVVVQALPAAPGSAQFRLKLSLPAAAVSDVLGWKQFEQ